MKPGKVYKRIRFKSPFQGHTNMTDGFSVRGPKEKEQAPSGNVAKIERFGDTVRLTGLRGQTTEHPWDAVLVAYPYAKEPEAEVKPEPKRPENPYNSLKPWTDKPTGDDDLIVEVSKEGVKVIDPPPQETEPEVAKPAAKKKVTKKRGRPKKKLEGILK